MAFAVETVNGGLRLRHDYVDWADKSADRLIVATGISPDAYLTTAGRLAISSPVEVNAIDVDTLPSGEIQFLVEIINISVPTLGSAFSSFETSVSPLVASVSPPLLPSAGVVYELEVPRPNPYAVVHTGGRILLYPGYTDWMTDKTGRVVVYPDSTLNASWTTTNKLLIYSPVVITAIDLPMLESSEATHTVEISPGPVDVSIPKVLSEESIKQIEFERLVKYISLTTVDSEESVYTLSVENLKSVLVQSKAAEKNLLRSTIAGFFGPAQMRTNIYVSNISGDKLRLLPYVQAASISLNNFRDATWELSIAFDRNDEFNPFKDWIKIEAEVYVKDKWVSFPLGLYKFDKIGGSHTTSSSTWELTGYSGEILFVQDTLRNVRTIKAGSYILRTVRNDLIAAGVPEERISFPMSEDKKINTSLVFDPFNDESNGTKLRVWNTLLNAGGFFALYTDSEGRFVTSSYKDVRTQEPSVIYGDGGEKIVLDGISDNWDDESFANAVVVISEDPNQTPPIVAHAENNDPNSDASRVNLGFWKVKKVTRKTLPDLATAKKIAKSELQASSGFWRTIGWSTPPDPERGPKEYYSFNIGRENTDDITGIFRGGNFSMDVYPFPKEMSFEGSKTEEV